jgi:hypothetical protein
MSQNRFISSVLARPGVCLGTSLDARFARREVLVTPEKSADELRVVYM